MGERKAPKDNREESYEVEVDKSKMSSDDFIVIGDLNAKLDVDSNGQVYNDSPNGRLLLNVVEDQSLAVVNFSNKCSGTWPISLELPIECLVSIMNSPALISIKILST